MNNIVERLVEKSKSTAEPLSSLLLQAAAEITRLRQDNRQILEDEAETITAIREESRKVLATIDVDGDSYAVPSIEDIVESLVAEIARLRDELKSTTRHMELAEAAWLRETAGNSPVAVVLTDAEREVLEWATNVAESLAECGATGTGGTESHEADTLRKLLERHRR